MYKEKNDFDTAIKFLSDGIQNNPTTAFLYYNRGCTFANIGNLELSKIDIDKSIELDDFFIEYSKKDIDLQKLYEL